MQTFTIGAFLFQEGVFYLSVKTKGFLPQNCTFAQNEKV